MNIAIVLLCAGAAFANSVAPSRAPVRLQIPSYRLFAAPVNPKITQAQFLDLMNGKFIPMLPGTHRKNGAVAYVPALLEGAERALVIYEGGRIYRLARATPEGEEYARAHNEPFDMPNAKSGTAIPWDEMVAKHGVMPADVPVDVLDQPVNWQAPGHVTVYEGANKGKRGDFLKRVHGHVLRFKEELAGYGLEGYVMAANEGRETAFQRWRSREDMQAAFASKAGQSIAAEAGEIFDHVLWTEAQPFRGDLKTGQAANVLFTTRFDLADSFVYANRGRLVSPRGKVLDIEVEPGLSGFPIIAIIVDGDPAAMEADLLKAVPELERWTYYVRGPLEPLRGVGGP